MSFKHALDFLAKQEGGWVNDAHDRGGETFRGISRKAHPEWAGWVLVDSGIEDTQDLNLLVCEFYEKHYWFPAHCHELPEPLDLTMFDYAVHSGVNRAITDLQTLARTHVDGVFGPQTRGAVGRRIDAGGARRVAHELLDHRMRFMVRGFRSGAFSRGEPLRFLGGFWKRTLDLAFEIGAAQEDKL